MFLHFKDKQRTELRDVEQEIKYIYDSPSGTSTNETIASLRYFELEIMDLLHKEEIEWRLKNGSIWIKRGITIQIFSTSFLRSKGKKTPSRKSRKMMAPWLAPFKKNPWKS